jgi:beta-lactamase superfamily II metal-dependent hydrolase
MKKRYEFCRMVWLSVFMFAGNASIAQDTTSVVWKQGYLDIHHINTGRGVCSFFILPDGTTMMVDAGDIDDSSFVKSLPLTVTKPYPDAGKTAGQWIVNYIRQTLPAQKNPSIDYALITHFHSDHFGSITNRTKTSVQGNYKLTGLTEVGDLIPIKKLIDRNYPDYNYPVDLRETYKAEPSIFNNLQRFIAHHQKKGLVVESLKVGAASQIVLKNAPGNYPRFRIRGVKANGTIWTGEGINTFEYFTADSVVDAKKKFNENPLSLAIKLTYGKFDYFTGGDNTGLQGYGLPAWFDVETPMAKAVGKVEVTTLDHHGNRDATNENFLRYLQPKAVVEQTWCSDHPGQEVMHRLLSNDLYKGEKNIFATNIQEATKNYLGFWFTRGYKSMFGHVITRVLPGGDRFYILIAETINEKVVIRKVFGPYESE